jgi:hypothetical protein
METQTHICPACATKFSGNFCSHCGQKAHMQEVTFSSFVKTAFKSFFEVDRGFLHTLLQLLRQPQMVINSYMQGIGQRYTNPAKLLFIITSTYAFLALWLGLFDLERIALAELDTQEHGERFVLIFNLMKQYLNVFILLSVPFMAIGTYLAFKRRKKSYTYHLVLNAYIYSFTTVPMLLSVPFQYWLPRWLVAVGVVNSLIGLVYTVFVFKRNFEISIWRAIWKYILTSLVVVAIFFYIVFLVGVGYGVYMGINKGQV